MENDDAKNLEEFRKLVDADIQRALGVLAALLMIRLVPATDKPELRLTPMDGAAKAVDVIAVVYPLIAELTSCCIPNPVLGDIPELVDNILNGCSGGSSIH